MTKLRTVTIISKDTALAQNITEMLDGNYEINTFPDIQTSIDFIYNSMPNLVIMHITNEDRIAVTILNGVKSDPIFSQLPVLAIFDDSYTIPKWNYLRVDDYIWKSSVDKELAVRVDLGVMRAERAVDVNPLTMLPGNISISKQIQARIASGEKFALAYADLDHFKPFNDRYGFSRGDEVLKLLGRLILNNVIERQPHGSFVGHIGGDDFIFIMEPSVIVETSNAIISFFDKIVPTFYDLKDKEAGFIEAPDREGSNKTFPIISLSIGIAHNSYRNYTHYGEMAEAASEMKKFAKSFKGSYCAMDRRT